MLERPFAQGYLRRLGAAAIEPSRAIRPLSGTAFEVSRANAEMPDGWPGLFDGDTADTEELAGPEERATSTASSAISLGDVPEDIERPASRPVIEPRRNGSSIVFPSVSSLDSVLDGMRQPAKPANLSNGPAREATLYPPLDASDHPEARADAGVQAAESVAAPFRQPSPAKSSVPAHPAAMSPVPYRTNTDFESYAAAPQPPEIAKSEHFHQTSPQASPQAALDRQPASGMRGLEPRGRGAAEEPPSQPAEAREQRRGESRIEPLTSPNDRPRATFAPFQASADRHVPTSSPTAIWQVSPAPPDEIHIHIGRIEVTAAPPSAAPAAPRLPHKTLSLDDYLKRRR